MKKKTLATVITQKCLQPGIYKLTLETELAPEAHAGQFVGIYTKDASKLLPRPISIYDAYEYPSQDKGVITLVYRVTGPDSGTADLCKLAGDDEVYLIGPLGNGYDVDDIVKNYKHPVLMGGGIGIPPMRQLAKEICKSSGDIEPVVILGYRDDKTFLDREFEEFSRVYIATEDASIGTKGNVLNVMDTYTGNDVNANVRIECDVIMACGPMPMLRAIAAYAKEHNIKAYVSLEERMACGVGACLGCITKTKEVDAHSHVNNARICTDGPVFDADDLVF